jgi:hypothetical protein
VSLTRSPVGHDTVDPRGPTRQAEALHGPEDLHTLIRLWSCVAIREALE